MYTLEGELALLLVSSPHVWSSLAHYGHSSVPVDYGLLLALELTGTHGLFSHLMLDMDVLLCSPGWP